MTAQTRPRTAAAPSWPVAPEPGPEALALLGITDAYDLYRTGRLDGETAQEQAARWAAATDVMDERLAEITEGLVPDDVIRGWAA